MDHENDLYTIVKHFVRFVKLSQKDPVILTLDSHYSHSRNIEVIDRARDNGMHIFLPSPHSTLKLQTLDVSFLQPLRTLRTGYRNLAVKPSRVDIYSIYWTG